MTQCSSFVSGHKVTGSAIVGSENPPRICYDEISREALEEMYVRSSDLDQLVNLAQEE